MLQIDHLQLGCAMVLTQHDTAMLVGQRSPRSGMTGGVLAVGQGTCLRVSRGELVVPSPTYPFWLVPQQ